MGVFEFYKLIRKWKDTKRTSVSNHVRFLGFIVFFGTGNLFGFPDSPAPKKEGTPEAHWAFQHPVKPTLEGKLHPIDELLAQKQKEGGFEAVGEASRATRLRRLWHVATGLLPNRAERKQWMADKRTGVEWTKAATEAALARKTFGERWSRHWLDVARYADTKGAAVTNNEDYPYAYTYRDWVIGAFNKDLPYDRFVHLQVAADLMKAPLEDQAALGFLTVGRAYQGGQRHLLVADQIDVTTRGVMGLTVTCARCHDHKSDPIPTADFYSLYGVFASASMPKNLPKLSEPEDSPGYRKFKEEHRKLAMEVHKFIKSAIPEYETPKDLFDFSMRKTPHKLNQTQRDRFRKLSSKVTELEAKSLYSPDRAMIVREGKVNNPYIFTRGNPGARGEKVPRQFLKIFRKEGEVFKNGSGRLELAMRLTDDRNPLTARVWANRVWMHVMGTPLVDTPGDFGVETEKPKQLELLDHLAHFLVENKWSTKALITHITSSQSWNRESKAPAELIERDPENRYFARSNRVRKDLEAWRDSALQVSGRLDVTLGGKPVTLDQPPFSDRRTVYGRVRRGYLPAVMRAFDFPGSEEALMRRSETTTPMQALYLMNSPSLHVKARSLVKGLTVSPESVQQVYQQILHRPASKAELSATMTWLKSAATHRTAGAWDYGYLTNDSLELKSLPLYKDGRWAGGPEMPDPKLGWLMWSAAGGHPELDKSAVLSWKAIEDGELTIEGVLKVPTPNGNGVRGRVMRSDGTVLGEWLVDQGKESATRLTGVKVKAGEHVWFVVDSRGEQSHDSFNWAPRLSDARGEVANANDEFGGLGLRPLAQLAQVLLLSNEFFFVD